MRSAWVLFIFIFLWSFLPQYSFAHAVLVDAQPAPDSKLKEGPDKVTLTFNEAIKDGLFSVEIMNQDREKIQTENPVRREDGNKLVLILPELADGAYLLSYHVVSADGHPVKGSYVFLVGEASNPIDPKWESNQFQDMDVAIYFVRAAYYMGLLSLIGWVFWGRISKIGQSDNIRKKYKFTGLFLQQYHLLCLILLIVTQWLWNSTANGIPISTSYGVSWITSLLLSLLGFWVLFRSKWVDVCWVFLMLAAKSFNGHSVSYGPLWTSIPMNFLHLCAASIWVGGLLFITIFWRKHRLQVREFIKVFSRAAFISMVGLFLTGIVTTLLFIPEIDYLWETPWGRVLVLKVSLILLVIFVAWMVRSVLKTKPVSDAWKWITIDVFLMLFIILTVGGLSYLSPIPTNSPLVWEVQNEQIKMTMNISPKEPGENRFDVQFHNESVQRVELRLYYVDKEETPPILVPLKGMETKGAYSAEGYYLPFHGKWLAELKVIDSSGEEVIMTKRFRVFESEGNDR